MFTVGDDDLAGISRYHASQSIYERRLARPVRSDDARDLASFKGDRKLVDGMDAFESFD